MRLQVVHVPGCPGAAGQPPSLSCRLYRDENGVLSGSPSLAQLRDALARKGIDNG
jgi:hypothetical protein